jgi:hypothetical protein
MNVSGRIEENGMIRHRKVELCGVGALGFHLFGHFHLLGKDLPEDLTPDFDDEEYGDWGRRDWQNLYLFPGKNDNEPMSYESKCLC